MQYTMPTPLYCTRGGFPSVQTLEPATNAMTTASSKGPVGKSLFARAFEKHGASYFGIQDEGGQDEPMTASEVGVAFGGSKNEQKVDTETLERLAIVQN